MLSAQKLRSEVDRLLVEITAEYKAVITDITVLSHNSGYNIFMVFGINHVHILYIQLRDLVGDAAIAMIAKELETKRHQMISDRSQAPTISSLAPLKPSEYDLFP